MGKRVGLIQARKAAGYSQESFAEALEVDRSTVARWEAGNHEPLPYLRPKMARLLSVSRDELTELLWLPPSADGGDMAPTVKSNEPGGRILPQSSLLVPVILDGHPTVLPLDMSALTERQAWASMDDSLLYAGELEGTLHAVVELSRGDVKRRNFCLSGAAFTTAVFAEPALFALTAPPVLDVARDRGGRHIGNFLRRAHATRT